MRMLFFVLLPLLLILTNYVSVVFPQDKLWSRTIGTTGIGEGRSSVSVDQSSGAVFTTGTSRVSLHGETLAGSDDIIMIKHDKNGTRVFTRMVGTTGSDFGIDISVDSVAGAVYVTGFASGSLHGESYVGSRDIVLLKFSTNGTRLWTRMVGTSSGDEGRGVAVDVSTGAVYVCALISGSVHGQTYLASGDLLLMKYSGNGTRIWSKIVGTSGSDAPWDVAVDYLGAVYMIGDVSGSLHGEPYGGFAINTALVKYAGNGTRVWTRMIGSFLDTGRGVATDSTGAVYIAGGATSSLHGQTFVSGADVYLIKYSGNGTRIWTRMVGTAGDDSGFGVAVDFADAVFLVGYVTATLHGQTYSGGDDDMLLIKYNSNGTRVWTRLHGTSLADLGYGVALNSSGNVYIAGTTTTVGDTQYEDLVLTSYSNSQPATPQPTGQPSQQPLSMPTGQPSSQPMRQPSNQPTTQPTRQP